MLAKDIMTRQVITVSPEMPITEAAEILLQNRISGVPVVSADNELIGILTEGDLIVREKDLKGPVTLSILGALIYLENPKRFEEELRRITGVRVRDVMSKPVLTVTEDTPVADIASLMIEKGINRVPVMRHQHLVGIVTRADIVRSLLER
mgnify:CR=1 FL=1